MSQQTEGKIPNLLPEGSLTSETRLVLVNAVYFDFPWEEQFTKDLTKQERFYLSRSSCKEIPLMFKQHALGYAKKQGFQIAALPYAGGQMQFVVLVPDAPEGLGDLEKQLSAELLKECSRLKPTEVRLTLPRMKVELPSLELKDYLEKMGMNRAFSEAAEFNKMAPAVHISNVYHKTFLELDESGTKAAAATGVAARAKNGFPHEVPHKVVTANRPFLYLIQHIQTGTCLFIGRMMDPAPEVPEQEISPLPGSKKTS